MMGRPGAAFKFREETPSPGPMAVHGFSRRPSPWCCMHRAGSHGAPACVVEDMPIVIEQESVAVDPVLLATRCRHGARSGHDHGARSPHPDSVCVVRRGQRELACPHARRINRRSSWGTATCAPSVSLTGKPGNRSPRRAWRRRSSRRKQGPVRSRTEHPWRPA